MKFVIRPLTTIPVLFLHSLVGRKWIELYRNQQLNRLVFHAYKYVPYYRELFSRAGIKPCDIRTAEDLKTIPITSKKDIQQLPPNSIISNGIDPESLIVRKTSGSSGESMIIKRTWFEERLLQAFRYRAMFSIGYRMNDRFASIQLNREIDPNDNQILLRIANTFGFNLKLKIDCRQPFENILRSLAAYRPEILSGYPGVLSMVAERMTDLNRRKITPRLVITGGEVLTPSMRKQISRSFCAPVFDVYGSHEYNLIAWECLLTGEYHVSDDSLILEIIENGNPVKEGEMGEVVATNLHSFAMPFIRYRLGDIVTKGSSVCRCGKPFSTIKSIQGRMIDYLHLPDGRIIHPYEITSWIRKESSQWIQKYQMLQESKDRIIMQVIPFENFPPQKFKDIEEKIRLFLGKDVEFQITLVNSIDIEKTGKFRVSRSMVHSRYDNIEWKNQSGYK